MSTIVSRSVKYRQGPRVEHSREPHAQDRRRDARAVGPGAGRGAPAAVELGGRAPAGSRGLLARHGRRRGPAPRPVWGLWLEERLVLSVGSSTHWRNLEVSDRVAVHLGDAHDVVIVEGTAQRETDATELARIVAPYNQKYDWNWEPGPTVRRDPRRRAGRRARVEGRSDRGRADVVVPPRRREVDVRPDAADA